MNIYRLAAIIGLIVLAIISRFLPHPMNFTPIAAIALFGGAYFSNRWVALLAPLAIMLISDTLIELSGNRGFHSGMYVVYAAFLLVSGLGILMQNKITPTRVLISSVAGSLIFFLITNFVFFFPALDDFSIYTRDFSGVMASYTAGLPFLKNALIGDIFYSTILFGSFYLLERRFSVLKLA